MRALRQIGGRPSYWLETAAAGTRRQAWRPGTDPSSPISCSGRLNHAWLCTSKPTSSQLAAQLVDEIRNCPTMQKRSVSDLDEVIFPASHCASSRKQKRDALASPPSRRRAPVPHQESDRRPRARCSGRPACNSPVVGDRRTVTGAGSLEGPKQT